jgi:FixJ family two-component response regulator
VPQQCWSDAASKESASDVGRAVTGGRPIVFVVDDDSSVRRALRRLICTAGYEVEVFESAARYLEREPAERPACLVLDIRMPGTSGLDLQQAIGGTPRELPIVFITGHGDEGVRNQAMSAGAVDVLYKPLDQTILLDAIDRALSRAGGAP